MTETVPFRTGLSVDKQVHIYLIVSSSHGKNENLQHLGGGGFRVPAGVQQCRAQAVLFFACEGKLMRDIAAMFSLGLKGISIYRPTIYRNRTTT